MNEPTQQPSQPDYSKPIETTGPELPSVLREAKESGYAATRMKVGKGASYRVEFQRDTYADALPETSA